MLRPPMRASLSRGAWLLPVLLLLAGPARAERDADFYLASVSGLFARGEYERALELVKKARALDSKTLETDASLALWEGLLLSHLGKKEEATAPLEEAFLLEPDLDLPARLSPKIREKVEGVRARVKKELASRPRTKKVEAAPQPAPPPTPTPKVVTEPPSRLAPRPAAEQAAPPAWRPGAELASSPPGPPVVPLLLGGVAVGAGAAGAWFGLQAYDAVSAARKAEFQGDTATALAAANAHALVANVAFAAAGTAAAAALITLLVSR
jgi:tetratricopeptide (TPR) repeat protein